MGVPEEKAHEGFDVRFLAWDFRIRFHIILQLVNLIFVLFFCISFGLPSPTLYFFKNSVYLFPSKSPNYSVSIRLLTSLTLASLPRSPTCISTGWVTAWVDMWQCGGSGRGSRPVPRERGILIWAICNDRPPMSAEEWQVERLWQVLIAVRKSSWRMCQLHPPPLPVLSHSCCCLLCLCVSLCAPLDLCLSKVSEGLLSPPIFFTHPLFILDDIQEQLPASLIPSSFLPFLSTPPHRPHHLFSTAVDSCWHSTGIKTQPVLVCPMVIGKLPSFVSLPKQSGQYVMNNNMKKVYYCWKCDLDLLHNSHDFPLVAHKWFSWQDTKYSSYQPPEGKLKIKYSFSL